MSNVEILNPLAPKKMARIQFLAKRMEKLAEEKKKLDELADKRRESLIKSRKFIIGDYVLKNEPDLVKRIIEQLTLKRDREAFGLPALPPVPAAAEVSVPLEDPTPTQVSAPDKTEKKRGPFVEIAKRIA